MGFLGPRQVVELDFISALMILGLDGCAVSVCGLNRSPDPSHGSVAARTRFRLLHRQERFPDSADV